MGSTLVGPNIEDVDDVDLPSSHVIHIHEPDASSASTTATADAAVCMSADFSQQLSLLDEKFSLLLAAHSREAAAISARMDALEALKLGSLMAEAASSAAQSAAEAAQLVKSAGQSVETAATVMEAAREALRQISTDGAIPDLLAEHCVNGAVSAKDAVLQAIDECREDVEEFVEQTQQRADQKAAVAAGKRGTKKR